MLDRIRRHPAWHHVPIHLRVGIDTGPVVAGVIGQHKFIYELWGDAVNTASRMESNGLADVIQVTEAVKRKLEGKYTFEQREPINIKGKGQMVTYLLRP
jgi:class 3 adenylate cyclase